MALTRVRVRALLAHALRYPLPNTIHFGIMGEEYQYDAMLADIERIHT